MTQDQLIDLPINIEEQIADLIPERSLDVYSAKWAIEEGFPEMSEEEYWMYVMEDLIGDRRCDRCRTEGLRFKPSHYYMTKEGYPLGTLCWYIVCHYYGAKGKAVGRTQIEAIKRAIVWFEKHIRARMDTTNEQ